MSENLDRLAHLSALAIPFDELQNKLKPFVELAQFITDSPVCEINIIDAYNQWTIAQTSDERKVIPREKSVCYDSIQQDTPYEIADLKNNKRYKDRFYVKGEPYFRYYCGVQLVTSAGFNIGSICVLDTESKTISDEQKTQLGNLADLITQKIEAESRYKQASAQINEMKENVKKLSHDLRSPISGIVGTADLLMNDQEKVEVETEDLNMIKQAAESIIENIDGILDHLILQENNEPGETFTVEELQKKLLRLYNLQAQQKDLNLSIFNNHDTIIELPYQYATKLIPITGNLIANAIKFTNSGGKIEVSFTVDSDASKPFCITVIDDGEGMSENQISAFNNHQKVIQTTGTDGEKSFGIGLQHVRQMVTQLGGTISVKKADTNGTAFFVSLPFKGKFN